MFLNSWRWRGSVIGGVADLGQRHADDVDVVAEFRRRHRLGRNRRTGSRRDRSRRRPRPRSAGSSPPSDRRRRAGRACPASETRTSYQVGRPWMFEGKMLRDATGTPMRRIERANNLVGARRARAVDIGEFDDEIVDGFYLLRHSDPAYVMSRRNFCMSHAPVGQRSAHRPQCRHISSSLAMMRPVFSSDET